MKENRQDMQDMLNEYNSELALGVGCKRKHLVKVTVDGEERCMSVSEETYKKIMDLTEQQPKKI